MKKIIYIVVLFCTMSFLSYGCAVIYLTDKAVGAAGRLAVTTVKTTGKVVGKTLTLTGKGIKTAVNMAAGKHVIKLDKKGSSLLVDTVLNRKIKTKLILDTGCSDTQISEQLARELGIETGQGRIVSCMLADGRSVGGREVNIKEVRLGSAKVYNVRAIVLDSGCKHTSSAGLLGMSFLNNFIFKVDSENNELVLQRRVE